MSLASWTWAMPKQHDRLFVLAKIANRVARHFHDATCQPAGALLAGPTFYTFVASAPHAEHEPRVPFQARLAFHHSTHRWPVRSHYKDLPPNADYNKVEGGKLLAQSCTHKHHERQTQFTLTMLLSKVQQTQSNCRVCERVFEHVYERARLL